MKDNIKKYTNLSIAASVAVTSISTTGMASVLDSAMSNLTYPGIYEEVDSEGNVISTNYYTGGLSYSFDNSYPPPIISTSPPTIEAGCNGINIKGMFVSLLGLDQLGAMLQNAGASLAWGVAVGLIYSLPGVASAFKMINKWAKDIQNLLGNMCQSGINIGKSLAEKHINKGAIDKKINSTVEDLSGCKQEGENCVVNALGLGDYFDSNGVFSFGGNSEEMSPKDKVDALSVMFRGIYESDISMGGKMIMNFIKTDSSGDLAKVITGGTGVVYNMNGEMTPFKKYLFSLDLGGVSNSNGLPVIGIDAIASTKPSESEKTRAKLELWAYILLYNFAGELTLKNPGKIIDSSINKFIEYGSAKNKEKALAELENLKKLNSPQINLAMPNGFKNEETAGKQMAEFIIDGKFANNIRLIRPVFMAVKATNEKEAKAGLMVISMASPETSYSPKLDVSNYEGLEKASTCVIKAKIRGVQPNAIPDCANTTTVPVVFDGIERFIKIIQNSPMRERYQLEEALIKYNTQLTAIGLIYAMQSSFDEVNGFAKEFIVNTGGTFVEANTKGATQPHSTTAEKELSHLKHISKVIESAKKAIKEKTGNLDGFKEVKRIFDAQELKNRARGMRNSSN